MNKVIVGIELNGVRGEADLYGYSLWLAKHLGLEVCPKSIRGFQHGWIWWDIQPGDRDGFDPNFNKHVGCLVQDEKIEKQLLSENIFAKACGLPFLNFLANEEIKVKRNKGKLYVPAHSNAWGDISKIIDITTKRYANKGYSVMLGWNDRHLRPEGFEAIEIGAGALETTSFYRMADILLSYEEMVTDSIGSHVLYGLACGMKVGIDANTFELAKSENTWVGTVEGKVVERTTSKFYNSLDYIDQRYPGLVIQDNCPNYNKMPLIGSETPENIAKLLGWEYTIHNETMKV